MSIVYGLKDEQHGCLMIVQLNREVTMFAKLPCHVRMQLVSLLVHDDFPAAKRLYATWVHQLHLDNACT